MQLTDTPLFGIILCLLAYEIALFIYKKTKLPYFNPLLISIAIIIAVLSIFDIDYDTFNIGGSVISLFLGPATVVLAVPLYKQLDKLTANILPILSGIIIGSAAGLTSVYALARLLKLPTEQGLSLLPKSVTAPIGMEISKQIGGNASITVASIIITGIIGAVILPAVFRITGINDKIAIGLAIGTSAHAVGTTKAVELGETEGAMSSLAIGVAGLITVFLSPLFAWLFS